MKKLSLYLSFLLVIFFSTAHYLDLDDKLLYKLFDSSKKIPIETIKNTKSFKEISEIKENLSGITYNENTDTLFAITNSPRDIYELTEEGNFLRKIKLHGFADTEDIVYIKDNMFAILDEELSAFFIVNIFPDTMFLSPENSIKKFSLDVRNFENFGLEGITYDRLEDKFYVVNERNPKKLFSIKGLFGTTSNEIKVKDEILENNDYLSDFSAVHFDDKERKLYILSEESLLLGRLNHKNDFDKYFDLKSNKISSKMTNSEGITTDMEGNIYIVGEPNHFLSIKKD